MNSRKQAVEKKKIHNPRQRFMFSRTAVVLMVVIHHNLYETPNKTLNCSDTPILEPLFNIHIIK